mgnify:CR=1 FL=1
MQPSSQNILVVGDNAVRLLNQGGGSSELKVKVWYLRWMACVPFMVIR